MSRLPEIRVDGAVSVGGRLRLLRLALGLTKSQICEATGINQPTWSNYEAGKNRPDHDQAALIRRRYGVSFDWLYWDDLSSLKKDLADPIERMIQDPSLQVEPKRVRRKNAA